MVLRHQWSVLGLSAFCALGLSLAGLGCRTEPTPNGTGSGGGGEGGTGTSSGGNMNVGGASSSSSSGAGGTAGAGGSGGAPACAGDVFTVQQVANPMAPGAPGDGSSVELKGVVATSRKFLINQSKSGTCLWGVYVSAPGLTEAAEYSGLLVVSRGADAYVVEGGTKAYCPKLSNYYPEDVLKPGDAIPDDTMPGDVLDVIGVSDSYITTTGMAPCGSKPTDTKIPMRQLAFTCSVKKTGTAEVPAPHTLTEAEVAMAADQANADFHTKWAATRLRVANVSPVPVMDPNGGPDPVVVGSFGMITLAPSNLQVGDTIYYRGYEKNHDDCFTGPVFTNTSVMWNHVQGHHYLNYCTWGLEASNKCADFDPGSEDCAAKMLMCK